MATTRSRPRGRESARPSTGGVVAEHATKIYSVAVGAVVVIIAFLALTGHPATDNPEPIEAPREEVAA